MIMNEWRKEPFMSLEHSKNMSYLGMKAFHLPP